jgi:hypothetical protein
LVSPAQPAVPPEQRRARPLAPQVQRVPLLAQRQVRPAEQAPGQVARALVAALVAQVPVVQVPVAQVPVAQVPVAQVAPVARAQAAGQAATRPFAALRTTEK